MLSESSIEEAFKLGHILNQDNIKLIPRQGSPLDFLASTFSEEMGGNALANGPAEEVVAHIADVAATQGKIEGISTSVHGEKMDWAVKLIARGVTSDLQLARNEAVPLITQLTEAVQKDWSAKTGEIIHGYQIVSSDIDKIFNSTKIENLFERYATGTLEEVRMPGVFPDLEYNEIARRVKTGDEELNKCIDDILINITPEGVCGIYSQYFKSKFAGDVFNPKERLYGDDRFSLEAMLVVYFLSLGLMADLPDGVDASSSSLQNMMDNFRGAVGVMIKRRMAIREQSIKDKVLVVDYNRYTDGLQDCPITVNKVVYENFLEAGGSPEAIFGAVIANATLTYDSILERKLSHEVFWNNKLEFYRSANIQNKLTVVIESIRSTVNKLVNDIETNEVTGSNAERRARLKEVLSYTYAKDIECLGDLCRRVICRVFYSSRPSMEFIITAIDKFEAQEGESAAHVAGHVTLKLVSEWVAKNIQAVTGA